MLTETHRAHYWVVAMGLIKVALFFDPPRVRFPLYACRIAVRAFFFRRLGVSPRVPGILESHCGALGSDSRAVARNLWMASPVT